MKVGTRDSVNYLFDTRLYNSSMNLSFYRIASAAPFLSRDCRVLSLGL